MKPSTVSTKAVAYYRSAREDDESITSQRAQAEDFAAKRGLSIIHEEVDNGIGGLTADRPGLNRLLGEWVTNPGSPDFGTVIMRDPTRLGRFQQEGMLSATERIFTDNGKAVAYISGPSGPLTVREYLSRLHARSRRSRAVAGRKAPRDVATVSKG